MILTTMDPSFQRTCELSEIILGDSAMSRTYPTFEKPVPLSQMMGARNDMFVGQLD